MARIYTPAHKKWSDQGIIIPNVEHSEGIRPWIGTEVAPYLPLGLYEEFHKDYYVMNTGKAVSLDSLGYVTLAGLGVQIDTVRNHAHYLSANLIEFSSLAAHASLANVTRYDATDVAQGVRASDGILVVANEPVIWSMMISQNDQKSVRDGTNAGAATAYADAAAGIARVDTANEADSYNWEHANAMTVGDPIGVAPYSYYRSSRSVAGALSGDAALRTQPIGHHSSYAVWDPTQLRFHNHNKQGRVAVLCDYVCAFPVVSDTTELLLEGATVFKATLANIRPGLFVEADSESNLTLQNLGGGNSVATWTKGIPTPAIPNFVAANAVNTAEVAAQIGQFANRRMGQIIRYLPRHVDTASLGHVKSRFSSDVVTSSSDFTDIDRLPGSANAGLPWANWVTGRTDNSEDGVVLINLTTR